MRGVCCGFQDPFEDVTGVWEFGVALLFTHKSLDSSDESLQEGRFTGCEWEVCIDVSGMNMG